MKNRWWLQLPGKIQINLKLFLLYSSLLLCLIFVDQSYPNCAKTIFLFLFTLVLVMLNDTHPNRYAIQV
jgi:hypothetical protein